MSSLLSKHEYIISIIGFKSPLVLHNVHLVNYGSRVNRKKKYFRAWQPFDWQVTTAVLSGLDVVSVFVLKL